jgi:hypothetical protein
MVQPAQPRILGLAQRRPIRGRMVLDPLEGAVERGGDVLVT